MARKSKPYPIDASLYARVKREAMRKFDVYPSIVANAWIVREYKKRGGRYGGERAAGGITRWFREDWVDISRPRADGSFPFCARPSQGRAAYPKCVPIDVARAMSASERRAAVARKRRAEASAPGKAPKARRPINARTF